MAYIGPAPKFGDHQKQVITGDSSTVTFTLDYYVTDANSIMVIYNGVIQEPGTGKAYTTSGNSITFSVAPTTGSTCWIIFLGIRYDVGTVADGAITEAKLDSAVAAPILLATVTASASATVDFEDYFASSAYSSYLIQGRDIIPATDDTVLWLRIEESAAWKSGASDYQWGMRGSTGAGTAAGAGEVGGASIKIGHTTGTFGWGNATGEGFNFDTEFGDLSGTTLQKNFSSRSWGEMAAGTDGNFITAGRYIINQNEITGVRFLMSSGNITSGTFKLYGLI